MEKKKPYEAPTVKRVRLDIKSSVMGYCQQTPDWIITPTCTVPGSACPTIP
jgi:hypothetical protein